jgi:small acid-soluble spore protein (thioredoxin-like protein)
MMAKPDNRADNAEKLQSAVQNTLENMEEAQEYLSEHADEISNIEKSDIEQKNARRRESIKGMKNEIQDEQQF